MLVLVGGHGRGCGQTSSTQRIVGKQASKLYKKYHLSDIPKFITEADEFKRPFSSAERKKKMHRLNRPYRYALSKHLQAMKPEQVKARNEQLKKLYAERQAQRVQSNSARRAEDQQEAADQALADNEANKRVALVTRQLESAKLEAYKIVHGASSGDQLDKENQYRRPTPRSNTRGQQCDKNRQPANLNTMDSFRFAGESVNRQSYSRPSTTTTSLTSRARLPRTTPAATVSRPAPVAATAIQSTLTVERQNVREVTSVAGANDVPILPSWGLPQPDTITNDGINLWIQQVIGAYTTGNPAALVDSC